MHLILKKKKKKQKYDLSFVKQQAKIFTELHKLL